MNKQTTINHRQFLGFYLTPEIQVMLPTPQLVKILSLELTAIVPIPDMPEAVVGVFPCQGKVLWLIDLAYLFGLKPLLMPDFYQDKCHVLKVISRNKTIGLLVYQIGQLVRCDVSQIKPPTTDQSISYYQPNWLHLNQEVLPILDVEAIIKHLA